MRSVHTYTSVEDEEVGEVSDTIPVCLYLSVNTYTSVEDEVVGKVSDTTPVCLYLSVEDEVVGEVSQ